MENMRIILRFALLLLILQLSFIYFDGNKFISSIAQQLIIANAVSNSTYIANSSKISFSTSSTSHSFAHPTTSGALRRKELQGSLSQNDSTFESDSDCKLPQLDPWDRSVASLINKKFNQMSDCKLRANILTVLQNGTLKLTRKGKSYRCAYRCILHKTDSVIIKEDWRFLNISAVPNCDIVETRCNSSGHIKYKRMHFQIVPLPNITTNKNTNRSFKPSVFILLFDSVSRSSAIRSMPKTIKVLKKNYGAFDFRGLNKVGKNSLPNGYAFLAGIRIEEFPSVDFHKDEKLPSERPNFCKEYVDNSTFIVRNFTSAGYVSLMAEDWTYGVFKVPGCIGFSKKPTTHYMRPFYVRMDQDKMLREQTLKQQCSETHTTLMEYQKHFLKAYPTAVPKLSLLWMINLAHGNLDGLFHVDKYFANFFQKNRPLLRESFVFMMSDHGMNFGSVRKTKVGNIENGNPMLYVTVPETLRKNKQLMDNLQTNSAERLISQFDVYTTLLDIAAVAPRTNWTDFGAYNWSQKEGLHQRQSSFLRPLDPKRTCSFMQISEAYCICERHETTVSNDNQTAIDAAMFLNKELMRTIGDKRSHDICADLTFEEVVKASIIKGKNKKGTIYIYRITFVVSPSNGTFQADVRQTRDGFRLTSLISRINAYGNSSHCTNDAVMRPVCFCRDML